MTMSKEHKVEVDLTSGNLLFIDGVPYVSKKVVKEKIDGVTHFRKAIYRKGNKKEIDAIFKKIVDKIKSKTSKEELLTEILKEKYSLYSLEGYAREIDKNGEVKKQEGCIGFKIGKKYMQLLG
mgnify:CR=1 FL=1